MTHQGAFNARPLNLCRIPPREKFGFSFSPPPPLAGMGFRLPVPSFPSLVLLWGKTGTPCTALGSPISFGSSFAGTRVMTFLYSYPLGIFGCVGGVVEAVCHRWSDVSARKVERLMG